MEQTCFPFQNSKQASTSREKEAGMDEEEEENAHKIQTFLCSYYVDVFSELNGGRENL